MFDDLLLSCQDSTTSQNDFKRLLIQIQYQILELSSLLHRIDNGRILSLTYNNPKYFTNYLDSVSITRITFIPSDSFEFICQDCVTMCIPPDNYSHTSLFNSLNISTHATPIQSPIDESSQSIDPSIGDDNHPQQRPPSSTSTTSSSILKSSPIKSQHQTPPIAASKSHTTPPITLNQSNQSTANLVNTKSTTNSTNSTSIVKCSSCPQKCSLSNHFFTPYSLLEATEPVSTILKSYIEQYLNDSDVHYDDLNNDDNENENTDQCNNHNEGQPLQPQQHILKSTPNLKATYSNVYNTNIPPDSFPSLDKLIRYYTTVIEFTVNKSIQELFILLSKLSFLPIDIFTTHLNPLISAIITKINTPLELHSPVTKSFITQTTQILSNMLVSITPIQDSNQSSMNTTSPQQYQIVRHITLDPKLQYQTPIQASQYHHVKHTTPAEPQNIPSILPRTASGITLVQQSSFHSAQPNNNQNNSFHNKNVSKPQPIQSSLIVPQSTTLLSTIPPQQHNQQIQPPPQQQQKQPIDPKPQFCPLYRIFECSDPSCQFIHDPHDRHFYLKSNLHRHLPPNLDSKSFTLNVANVIFDSFNDTLKKRINGDDCDEEDTEECDLTEGAKNNIDQTILNDTHVEKTKHCVPYIKTDSCPDRANCNKIHDPKVQHICMLFTRSTLELQFEKNNQNEIDIIGDNNDTCATNDEHNIDKNNQQQTRQPNNKNQSSNQQTNNNNNSTHSIKHKHNPSYQQGGTFSQPATSFISYNTQNNNSPMFFPTRPHQPSHQQQHPFQQQNYHTHYPNQVNKRPSQHPSQQSNQHHHHQPQQYHHNNNYNHNYSNNNPTNSHNPNNNQHSNNNGQHITNFYYPDLDVPFNDTEQYYAFLYNSDMNYSPHPDTGSYSYHNHEDEYYFQNVHHFHEGSQQSNWYHNNQQFQYSNQRHHKNNQFRKNGYQNQQQHRHNNHNNYHQPQQQYDQSRNYQKSKLFIPNQHQNHVNSNNNQSNFQPNFNNIKTNSPDIKKTQKDLQHNTPKKSSLIPLQRSQSHEDHQTSQNSSFRQNDDNNQLTHDIATNIEPTGRIQKDKQHLHQGYEHLDNFNQNNFQQPESNLFTSFTSSSPSQQPPKYTPLYDNLNARYNNIPQPTKLTTNDTSNQRKSIESNDEDTLEDLVLEGGKHVVNNQQNNNNELHPTPDLSITSLSSLDSIPGSTDSTNNDLEHHEGQMTKIRSKKIKSKIIIADDDIDRDTDYYDEQQYHINNKNVIIIPCDHEEDTLEGYDNCEGQEQYMHHNQFNYTQQHQQYEHRKHHPHLHAQQQNQIHIQNRKNQHGHKNKNNNRGNNNTNVNQSIHNNDKQQFHNDKLIKSKGQHQNQHKQELDQHNLKGNNNNQPTTTPNKVRQPKQKQPKQIQLKSPVQQFGQSNQSIHPPPTTPELNLIKQLSTTSNITPIPTDSPNPTSPTNQNQHSPSTSISQPTGKTADLPPSYENIPPSLDPPNLQTITTDYTPQYIVYLIKRTTDDRTQQMAACQAIIRRFQRFISVVENKIGRDHLCIEFLTPHSNQSITTTSTNSTYPLLSKSTSISKDAIEPQSTTLHYSDNDCHQNHNHNHKSTRNDDIIELIGSTAPRADEIDIDISTIIRPNPITTHTSTKSDDGPNQSNNDIIDTTQQSTTTQPSKLTLQPSLGNESTSNLSTSSQKPPQFDTLSSKHDDATSTNDLTIPNYSQTSQSINNKNQSTILINPKLFNHHPDDIDDTSHSPPHPFNLELQLPTTCSHGDSCTLLHDTELQRLKYTLRYLQQANANFRNKKHIINKPQQQQLHRNDNHNNNNHNTLSNHKNNVHLNDITTHHESTQVDTNINIQHSINTTDSQAPPAYNDPLILSSSPSNNITTNTNGVPNPNPNKFVNMYPFLPQRFHQDFCNFAALKTTPNNDLVDGIEKQQNDSKELSISEGQDSSAIDSHQKQPREHNNPNYYDHTGCKNVNCYFSHQIELYPCLSFYHIPSPSYLSCFPSSHPSKHPTSSTSPESSTPVSSSTTSVTTTNHSHHQNNTATNNYQLNPILKAAADKILQEPTISIDNLGLDCNLTCTGYHPNPSYKMNDIDDDSTLVNTNRLIKCPFLHNEKLSEVEIKCEILRYAWLDMKYYYEKVLKKRGKILHTIKMTYYEGMKHVYEAGGMKQCEELNNTKLVIDNDPNGFQSNTHNEQSTVLHEELISNSENIN